MCVDYYSSTPSSTDYYATGSYLMAASYDGTTLAY